MPVTGLLYLYIHYKLEPILPVTFPISTMLQHTKETANIDIISRILIDLVQLTVKYVFICYYKTPITYNIVKYVTVRRFAQQI